MPDLYWVPGPWPGRLAISKRPRGGDWLEDEMGAWKEKGVSMVVSLLEEREAAELELEREPAAAQRVSIEFVALPVPDRGVPESLVGMAQAIGKVRSVLQASGTVAVHCRQGIGRSGMLAVGVLLAEGMDARQAMEVVSRARGMEVPETAEQREWLRNHLVSSATAG